MEIRSQRILEAASTETGEIYHGRYKADPFLTEAHHSCLFFNAWYCPPDINILSQTICMLLNMSCSVDQSLTNSNVPSCILLQSPSEQVCRYIVVSLHGTLRSRTQRTRLAPWLHACYQHHLATPRLGRVGDTMIAGVYADEFYDHLIGPHEDNYVSNNLIPTVISYPPPLRSHPHQQWNPGC